MQPTVNIPLSLLALTVLPFQQAQPQTPGVARELKSYATVTEVHRRTEGFHGWAFHSLPVSFDGQDVYGVTFKVNGQPVTPMILRSPDDPYASWAGVRIDSDQEVTVEMRSLFAIYLRKLKAGEPMKGQLSAPERAFYTGAPKNKTYATEEFAEFLSAANLLRGRTEKDIDFVKRVAQWYKANQRYIDNDSMPVVLSGFSAMKNGGGECVQLNLSLAAVLRYNRIPTRTRDGYPANRSYTDFQGHANTDVWLEGCGWTPCDAVLLVDSGSRPGDPNRVGEDGLPIVVMALERGTTLQLAKGVNLNSDRYFSLLSDSGKFLPLERERTTKMTMELSDKPQMENGTPKGVSDWARQMRPFNWNSR
jgi:hypothetical protein